jgi:protein TonB
MMKSWSLGAPPAGAATGTATGREAAIQALRGQSHSANPDVRGAENLGPDWLNEFSQWVEEHKRYPEQAIANMEDGTNEVTIRIRRDGQVEDVSLGYGSGSQWLDLGTQALFRGRRLPPFPPDAKDDEVTIQFTMHYVIVR